MSKNPNDLYNILNTLKSLEPTPEQKHQAQVQEIRESAEAPSTIRTGLETALTEKYMGFKKTVAAIKKGGSAENPEAVAAAIGRKKYGKAAFQKAAAAGKKMGEGEQLDELSPELKTRYYNKARADIADRAREVGGHDEDPVHADNMRAINNRYAGMARADNKAPKLPGQTESAVMEKAPPGMEDMVLKLKKQYPGHPEKAFATAWMIYNKTHGKKESVEEEVCNECGMYECMCEDPMEVYEEKTHKTEKGEVTRRDGVTTHRRTDLPGYASDDKEEDDDADAPKSKGGKGRPRKAQTKNPRRDPANKGKRGRPAKEKSDSERFTGGVSKSHDPFGRTKSTAHTQTKKGPKGHVHAMMESVNFKRMMEEQHMTLEEMLECMNADMKQFQETGVCSDRLRDMMEVYAHSKKQMEETAPYVPGGAKGGLPGAVPGVQKIPAAPRPGIGSAIKDTLKGIAGRPDTQHWELTKPQDDQYEGLEGLEEELNELARLAGIKAEGNAFTGKLASTPKGDKFELDGKEYTDTSNLDEVEDEGEMSDTCSCPEHDNYKSYVPNCPIHGKKADPAGWADMDEGNEFSGELAKARAAHKDSFSVDGKEYPVKEDTLADIAKLAGVYNEAKSYGDVEPDEDDVAVNKPDEKYMSMKASTMAPGEGDPGEKNNYDGPGDNKMKQQPGVPAKPVRVKEAQVKLEARLAQEYESIKKFD